MASHGIQFVEPGDFDKVVKYLEVPKPKIEKDTEVLVRVKAASINPVDLGIIKGTYPIKPKSYPATAGMEGMGVIEQVGAAVTTFKVGQRVHFRRFSIWQDYIILDTAALDTRIIPLPDTVSDEDGAQLSINPFTVLAMIHELKIGAGEFVIQDAAASSLGRILIQVAKVKGFKTINLVRRKDQVEELKALGADYVIDAATEDVVAKVNEITNGAGAKYGLECVGGSIGELLVKSVGMKGSVLFYGNLTRENIPVDSIQIISKGINIKGFSQLSWSMENKDIIKSKYEEVLQLLASKQVTLASKGFPAKDCQAGFQHCKAPGKAEKTLFLFNQN